MSADVTLRGLPLRAEGITAGYGGDPVIRGITVSADPGQVVSLVGPNGSGKSTLLKSLVGIVHVSSGTVTVGGGQVTNMAPEEIARASVGYVPQVDDVFGPLTVRENLEMGSYRRGRAHRARNLDRVSTIFPRLRERMDQRAGTLSGGEQQMLAIGRGLMAEPRLLILDEPSLGLSPLLVEEMFALIARIRAEGLSVLLVEQNVVQSLGIADRAYVLEHGQFALTGPAATLMADPRLRQTYLGL